MKEKLISVQNQGNNKTAAKLIINNKVDFTPKVSVIIPVYNAEQYLPKCLDSVINQSLKEIEIICVDDGSTDNSLEILKEYAKKDNRISIITQKNLYAGIARNAGLAIAKGEYVYFFDADDWVLPDGLNQVYQIAKAYKSDMLKFKAKAWDEKKQIEKYWAHYSLKDISPDIMDQDLTFKEHPELLKMPNTPWSGIYRRQFLEEHKIRFDNQKCSNDVSFFMQCLVKAEKIRITPVYVCVYRTNNPKSLIGIRTKNFECLFNTFEIIKNLFKDEDFDIQDLLLKNRLTEIKNRFVSWGRSVNEETLIKNFNGIKDFLNKEHEIISKIHLDKRNKKFIKNVSKSKDIKEYRKRSSIHLNYIIYSIRVRRNEEKCVKKSYLLGIPFIKTEKLINKSAKKVKLFGFTILEMKAFSEENKKKYYLFKFIPIFVKPLEKTKDIECVGIWDKIKYALEYPVRLQEECDRLEAEIKELEEQLQK